MIQARLTKVERWGHNPHVGKLRKQRQHRARPAASPRPAQDALAKDRLCGSFLFLAFGVGDVLHWDIEGYAILMDTSYNTVYPLLDHTQYLGGERIVNP